MATLQAGTDYIGVGVGAAIINNDKKILLALRGQQAKNERGKWEIPGGAVEFNETFEDAIKREVREELGVEIAVGELLEVCSHIIPRERQHWVSPTYMCTILSGIPVNKEPLKCERVAWFTLEEAAQLPLSIVTQHDIQTLQTKKII